MKVEGLAVRLTNDRFALAWIGITLLIGCLSFAAGTTPLFIALQVATSALTLLAWRLLLPLAPPVAIVAVATAAKTFLISQPIKLLMWQPADSYLTSPIVTAAAIAISMLAICVGAVVWGVTARAVGFPGAMSKRLNNSQLKWMFYVCVTIGLAARAVYLVGHAQSVVFFYASYVTFAGVIARVVENRRSRDTAIFDWTSGSVLVAYAVLGLGSATRTELLNPVAFALALYMFYRTKPNVALLIGGLIALTVLVTIISPVVDYSRKDQSYGRDAFQSFVSTLGDIAADPSVLAKVQIYEQRYGDSLIRSGRLYYGRSTGLGDRFTPSQVDNLVAVGEYQRLPISYMWDGVRAVLPQALGVSRAEGVGYADLQAATSRHQITGALGYANYGMAGNFYFMGGLTGVFVGFLGLTIAMLGINELMVGRSGAPWMLTFLPLWLFQLADSNWAGILIALVHGTVICGGLMLFVWIFLNTRRARPRYRGRPSPKWIDSKNIEPHQALHSDQSVGNSVQT